jgi:hypothetical protein
LEGFKVFSHFCLTGGSLVRRELGGLPTMKILTTVSCRSGANIFIELFHFRGLLIVWDSTISGSLDRYLQRGKVTGA